MNLGRALESAGRSEEAVVRLSEAAESAADLITRRLAVTNLVYILGRIGRFDEALSRLKELRQLSRSQVAADIAEGRTRLAMGETVEGLAILARIPSRGRDDDGMEYGPHVVAAIRGEALASLGRFGEAADVVLDAVRSDGVLEADVGELVRWLLQAERSPAEITACPVPEDLVPMLGRVLRQPPPLADVLLDGAWSRFPERLEPLAAAASVAPRLPLARALVWSARLRQRGLAASCPLVAIGHDAGIDPVVRVRAAAALYGSFHDARAVEHGPGGAATSWTRRPGWLPKRRSAASPRRCCRRWRVRPGHDTGPARRRQERSRTRQRHGASGRRSRRSRSATGSTDLPPPTRRDRAGCSRQRRPPGEEA